MVRAIALALLCLVAAWPGAARASWLRAETKHFVVYSNGREENVRRLATDLELFDGMLRRFHRTAQEDGAGSNKLTVYVVADSVAIQRLCGGCRDILGFYVGRASGSVAFTPRNTNASGGVLSPRVVLFHEYAHHFLSANYAVAYPAWFSEGYAEFASTFQRDENGLTIGRAATHRAYGLTSGLRLPAARPFDPSGRKMTGEEVELLYGRGWLLTHYIMFDPDRRKRFAEYLDLFNSGTPSVAAATKAFGDLAVLDRELDRYLRARTIKALVVRPEVFPAPEIAIRALSAGEAALVDERMVSTRGVNGTTAKPLYAKARAAAARYPDDPVAQGWLAEMAFDADDLNSADAAADRALARDPKSSQALLYKGMIGLRRAARDKAPPAAWTTARKYLVQANKLDPDSALPLFMFYQGFVDEGREPTRNAIAGLFRAQELAPQDDDLRFTAVTQAVRNGELDRARQLLRPLAYDPHGGADNPMARLLVRLEAAKDKAGAEAALKAMAEQPASAAPPTSAPTPAPAPAPTK